MQSKAIETQPSSSPLVNQAEGGFLTVLRTACAATIIVMIISTVAVIIYDRLSKRRLHYLFETNSDRVTPCHRCRYLGDNSYLRCALHPSTVLTKQAIDCQDYHPNMQGRVW